MTVTEEAPSLRVMPARGEAKAVVLVLHGGAEASLDRVRGWSGPYLRMLPFARSVHAVGRPHGLEVCMLRNRVRGWNKPALDPVRDCRWALEEVRRRHPDLPMVLFGHSMGGRVALRVADDPRVLGVGALAPWTTDKDWVRPVAGKKVLVAHGTGDIITQPESSYEYARRASEVADVVRFEVAREGHAMVRRPATWTRLVRAFALDTLGISASEPLLRAAWGRPAEDRLRVRV